MEGQAGVQTTGIIALCIVGAIFILLALLAFAVYCSCSAGKAAAQMSAMKQRLQYGQPSRFQE